MIYKVNIEDIEEALNLLGGEARAIEIQNKIQDLYCPGEFPENYINERSFRQTIQRKIEDYCPQAEGFELRGNPIKFLRVDHGLYRIANITAEINTLLAEEVENPEQYEEGTTKSISINYFERSKEARKLCIEHYGCSCVVCKLNFEERYGEIGKNFIHVHHLIPLYKIGENYIIDPVKDLRPVCPNCHSMIHRRKEPIDIEELKLQLTNRKNRL